MDRQENKKVVVVLGMHRAGTSVLTRIANLLGVQLGGPLLAASEDNPKGYWEHEGITNNLIKINRKVNRMPMGQLGSAPYPHRWWERADIAGEIDQLRSIVRAELDAVGNDIWGFKDPHACRMIPLLRQVFQSEGAEAVYVLSVRNPVDVAASLGKRDKLDQAKGELLWLQHYSDVLVEAHENIAVVSHYEKLFAEPEAQILKIATALPFLFDSDTDKQNKIESAIQAIDPKIRHHSSESDAFNPMVRNLYDRMRTADVDAAHEVALGIKQSADLFSPWVKEIERLTKPTSVFAVNSRQMNESADLTLKQLERGISRAATNTRVDKKEIAIVLPEQISKLHLSGATCGILQFADQLANDGHKVCFVVPNHEHLAVIEKHGLVSKSVPGVIVPKPVPTNPEGILGKAVKYAFEVYCWAKEQNFDCIHFVDSGGSGLYCVSAKRSGVAFTNTTLSVIVNEPFLLNLEENKQPLDEPTWLVKLSSEQRTVELADQVFATNATVYQWMVREGFQLDESRTLFQYLPVSVPKLPTIEAIENSKINEIVFCSVLEIRKGLVLFLNALGRSEAVQSGAVKVSFWFPGNKNQFYINHIRNWSQNNQINVKFLDDLDHDRFLKHIASPNRLPIILDTSGRATLSMLTCMAMNKPFLAFRSRELEELLRWGTPGKYLCTHQPHSVAKKLDALVTDYDGDFAHSLNFDSIRQEWLDWHNQETLTNLLDFSDEKPLVTICVMHHERPHLLEQALLSVEEQTYANLEVVVVDDGSISQNAQKALKELETRKKSDRWKLVRQTNKYLGAARNTGARHAQGKYIFFLDDDNCLEKDAISILVKAAESFKADIVGSFSKSFYGECKPTSGTLVKSIITQSGTGLPFGLLRNGFLDSNGLILRDFFNRLGGNTEEYGVGKDDQEFFARALLNDGKMLVVPEPLYWARQLGVRLRHKHVNAYAGQWRVANTYVNFVPPAMRNLLRYTQGAFQYKVAQGLPSSFDAALKVNSRRWKLTLPLRRLLQKFEAISGIKIKNSRVFEEEANPDHPPAEVSNKISNSLLYRITLPLSINKHLYRKRWKTRIRKLRIALIYFLQPKN